ncbi:3-hydroxyisobutyrate dehydrogenase-like beta-hydroxyacid dehydrogenase [Actinokineospora auranticolor]|uniref:3-hydroxyisobutyrate dehydrogenase-like beta-hydroxyacid dehydrogenase n=2 Tax=Actinokineospora auranticolor TaxID=155976 RepID=A0A2S6GJJ6_9PSEU|nr:3-hydroxyisobutyrate dehydrogenase-like beta-hydroxyacid dehydrogenase [Actinokineospora auranticolor]
MGRAIARAFLAAGHTTTVWNRTPGKGDDLVGAVVAGTAADAVRASGLVVVCVIDYAAVREVLRPVAAELKGRTLVNLTADSPDNARAMADWAAQHGIDYLDGSILSPAATVGGPDAVVIYSGPEERYRAHQDTLSALGGVGTHLGTDPGRAAAFDVALLDLFWTSMSGVVHAFALARAEGVAGRELAPFARGIAGLLAGVVTEYAEHVDTGTHPGDDSTTRSALAGIRHVLHATRAKGLDAGVLTAAEAVAARAVESGRGDAGFSAVVDVL